MPTPEEIKDLIQKLNAQHPNPWVRGVAYPATNPVTGHPCKIRRTTDTKTRTNYLHIYTPITVVLRTPDGQELSRRPGQAHYRANLRTFELVRID